MLRLNFLPPDGAVSEEDFYSLLLKGSVGLWALSSTDSRLTGAVFRINESLMTMLGSEESSKDYGGFLELWLHPDDRAEVALLLRSLVLRKIPAIST